MTKILANTDRNVELYAKWDKTSDGKEEEKKEEKKEEEKAKTYYTIKFEVNGGSAIEEQKVLSGEKLTKPKNPTKKSYSFSGWYIDSGLKTKFNFEEAITNNKTLYAKWSKVSSGGGGGGGGSLPNANQNNLLQQTSTGLILNNTKEELSILVAKENALWNFDNLIGKWKLSVKDENGNLINQNSRFYQIFFVDTINDNGIVRQYNVIHTYYIDDNGNLYVGWIKTADGNWYYFDDDVNSLGLMVTYRWKYIDGYWYFFDEYGRMLTNTITPDGCVVGADGKWIAT